MLRFCCFSNQTFNCPHFSCQFQAHCCSGTVSKRFIASFSTKTAQRLAIYGWLHFWPVYNYTIMKCHVHFRLVKMCLSLAVPPPAGTRWIQCKGHRCLATMTNNAKWKCFASDEILGIVSDAIKLWVNSSQKIFRQPKI